jgi:hypothetical protein
MSRYLRAIGLAVIAVSALAAFSASSASAATDHFTAASYPVDITAGHEASDKIEADTFTYSGTSVVCQRTTGTATVKEETTEITLTNIAYDECKFGTNPATIDMEGCDYLFTGETNAEGHAPVHVVCPEGKHIIITVPAVECNLTIKNAGATNGSMTPEGGLSYTTNGSDVTAKITVKGIHVIKDPTGTNFACSLLPKEGFGVYNGKQTLTGFQDGQTHDAAHSINIDFKSV